jgi:hypothetical protein
MVVMQHMGHTENSAAFQSPHDTSFPALRRGEWEDESEFVRLFRAMANEAGIEDFNIHKVRAMFHRAIRQDRAALVVAGNHHQLWGMALFGYQYPWYADGARMTVLSVFVDVEQRESSAAEELHSLSRLPVSQQKQALELLMTA